MALIVFVCRGNTCRSPLAEVLARAHSRDATLRLVSAGITPAEIGGSASVGSLEAARAAGLDLSKHRTRAADAALLAEASAVIALDSSVRDAVLARMPPAHHHRVSLLLAHAADDGARDVVDPYGGDASDYARAFQDIERGVHGLLANLKQIPPM